ncbi:MAG: penicillin-binding protein 1C [Elusimicrobiaceae bacterium]|nr:penicillin-binding protein 1C [Elusimicrobiaceae bacterium]
MRTLLTGVLLCFSFLAWGGENAFQPSRQFYDRHGVMLRGLLSSRKTHAIDVALQDISPWLVAAAVAAEDKRFFAHSGVDSAAVLRALWQNTKEGSVVSGASTITQQLVRTLEPRPKNLWGKITEAGQALLTERNQTKEEILEQYFNRVELGNLTQGVEAASRFYFNRSSGMLSPSQAAFLVGLIKSPTYYNPLKHFTRALQRRDYVLKRMHEEGMIDEELYQLALAEKITLEKSSRPFEAPHFLTFILPFLPTQGTVIYTTLDQELQNFVQTAVKTQIDRLTQENVTNAAVVVIDNLSGGILAYVGSADFRDKKNQGQVDGVRALRQPGSALKPFVYGLGFETGKLTPSTLLEDNDTFFDDGFHPRNYDETFHGWVSVRNALGNSYNIPAVKAAEKIGVENLLAWLHKAGLSSLDKSADFYGLGLALGNGEVRLLELANVYASLARLGEWKPLRLAQQPSVFMPGHPVRLLSPQTAYLITDILKDNQARTEAFGLNSPLSLPFEFAAKTGTSKDYKDNWAIGYTTRWTIGVWVGNFNATPMQKVSGITGAGPILHEIALFMQKKYPSDPFETPSNVVRRSVCTDSGLLAGKTCTHRREEVFHAAYVPAVCDGNHHDSAVQMRIVSPLQGDIYKIDPSTIRASQRLKIEAACSSTQCAWQLNGKKLSQTACRFFWPLAAGKYNLSVSCNAQTHHVSFEVLP